MDINSVEKLISENTVALVGVAGTTELGMIDPIPELSDVAIENDLYLHVDAAFGGFSIPFLRDIGYDIPEFDFKLKGVQSITIDPHKMGLAPIPTGGILFREQKYLDQISVDTPYLTDKKQSTIVGTRTGASSAATWALLKYLGKDGYTRVAERCMKLTRFLAIEIENAGFKLVNKSNLNIVAFQSDKISIQDVMDGLEHRGWAVSVSSYPRAIRIIVMPHLKKEHLEEFLEDLKSLI
jgi:tyrosine decarboxylase/aspartate 1-decarboxylase